ncbi:MAG: 50S ribosomal protein L9 [Patescibacteria group bacterium]|jgi:large subunit ribosomal protein L9
MKIILLKNVPGTGEAGEIKEVANGHAQNYLFPRKLAVEATAKNLQKIKEQQSRKAKEAEQDLLETEKTANRLSGLALEIKGRINDSGRLYASISDSVIAKKLKEKGFEISKKQIVLPEPIKELGDYPIRIELAHGLEAEIILSVID